MTETKFKSSAIENKTAQRFRDLADRTIVAPPNQFPYRAIGQIIVELHDGRRHQGTGTLLSDFTVLTAGHLVKNADNAFMDIAKMFFIPAMNHLSCPYGIYDWCQMRAVNAGTSNWALISLVEPAGHSVGFFGTYAQSPVEQWIGHRGLSHFGLPLELHDEMRIAEDVQIVRVEQRSRLHTDQQTVTGQVGGPLIQNWHSNNPQVVATLATEPRTAAGANEFVPGWESGTEDGWMTWLCDEFGDRHMTDRFQQHRSISGEKGTPIAETYAMQPDYSPFTYYADDDGPSVRYGASNARVEALHTL
jgi:V8-like Glu-specific endopeptidase